MRERVLVLTSRWRGEHLPFGVFTDFDSLCDEIKKCLPEGEFEITGDITETCYFKKLPVEEIERYLSNNESIEFGVHSNYDNNYDGFGVTVRWVELNDLDC